MSLLRTSLPSKSVPKMCALLPPFCQQGGFKRSPNEPTLGSKGARNGANRAVNTKTNNIRTAMATTALLKSILQFFQPPCAGFKFVTFSDFHSFVYLIRGSTQ